MSEVKNIWNDILTRLQISISTAAFEIYFKELIPVTIDGDVLVVITPKESKKKL